ncbi:diguanylate cyclase (GGDEF)-like protein [Chitinivorax tropicus]|uniref:diguanylate cyclase n=1 Tax=Chitinivorax tropicus TaxID=714531 RepID=A0A840MMH7_9PROT|nr:GGDEF domain-containing protein [Chitinivorax tropicus]MBB5019620.1 diguanylate cyclase (GGDEF)-like protein [Chitinivorax tropicus]
MSGIDTDQLFKRKAFMLAQTYFIKDNQRELLLHAHKYDFDILFFDQMVDFLQACAVSSNDDLFVVDLDSLYSLQKDRDNKTMFLSELLRQLPQCHRYVYLQTSRQGGRFLLQRTLVECNCLAYAEKPISNESLVEKLFNLFTQRRAPDASLIVALGRGFPFNRDLLNTARIELLEYQDVDSFNQAVKQRKPDIAIISEVMFTKMPAVQQVIRLNMETDPSLEIILHQTKMDAGAATRAIEMGFDDLLIEQQDPNITTRQLTNRIAKIRINKDLINKDRATGLLNKIGFKRKAQDVIHLADQRDNLALGLCVIDIDKFKTINDTWGHYFGDIVIKRLSLLLGAFMGPNDLLSRFGGEEFVMLFWDIQRTPLIQKLNQMREAFHQLPFEVEPGDIRHFSFSGGVAFFPELKSESDLFLLADEKLYDAKQGGRNQICS